jgi:peptide deformylase
MVVSDIEGCVSVVGCRVADVGCRLPRTGCRDIELRIAQRVAVREGGYSMAGKKKRWEFCVSLSHRSTSMSRYRDVRGWVGGRCSSSSSSDHGGAVHLLTGTGSCVTCLGWYLGLLGGCLFVGTAKKKKEKKKEKKEEEKKKKEAEKSTTGFNSRRVVA